MYVRIIHRWGADMKNFILFLAILSGGGSFLFFYRRQGSCRRAELGERCV